MVLNKFGKKFHRKKYKMKTLLLLMLFVGIGCSHQTRTVGGSIKPKNTLFCDQTYVNIEENNFSILCNINNNLPDFEVEFVFNYFFPNSTEVYSITWEEIEGMLGVGLEKPSGENILNRFDISKNEEIKFRWEGTQTTSTINYLVNFKFYYRLKNE